MTHKELKHLLPPLVYGDVTERERMLVEAHISECSECGMELERLKSFLKTVEEERASEPSPQLLDEAREDLHRKLISEHSRPRLRNRSAQAVSELYDVFRSLGEFPKYALALSGILVFFLGASAGYFALSVRSAENQVSPKAVGADFLKGDNYEISNVQFLNPDTGDGKVDVSFDAIRHLRTKGSVSDEPIKRLLTYALVNESNAGVRLKSIDIIKAFQFKHPDGEMKSTLVKVLKSDDNAGVRREALAALENFPMDDTIRDAFLNTLANDPNPGLRIAAIDGLVTKIAGQIWDQEILRALREKVQSDENKYIRVRAKNLLEDIRQQ